jgi:large subunit ribosomal protein L9
MKIILQKEVDKLGVPGDVVEVADGYARNFLIPRRLAAPATRGGERHAGRLKSAHEDRVRKVVDEAKALAAKVEASPIRIAARAGEDGRLFGSITAQQVAKEVQDATGVEVDRKHFHIDPIRSVGAHEVVLQLHPDVSAKVTIEVVAQ